MVTDRKLSRFGFRRHDRHPHLAFLPKHILLTAITFLALMAAAPSALAQSLSTPEYSPCGNVSINGGVSSATMALVWDWGDGNKTTSWFPATHRYTANGEFTVTVTVVGCHTFSLVTTAEIDNAATPGCPPVGVQTHYYLVPYNIHLTAGTTSAVPLDVVDQDGNSVSGALTFEVSGPQDLVSVSEYGYVTALREENPEGEAGIWINALLDGHPSLANKAVVRVLPAEYDIPVFTEALGERTGLCYPTSVNGQDIAAWVSQFEIPVVNEYSYQIQSRLMGTSPFDGGRQFFEVDLGITESNRVCGISGNPIRLGWNTAGDPWNPWQNCFLVPFPVWDPPPPLSPQWGVFYHELGHNMTWASSAFATGLGNLRPVGTFDLYSEGFASAIELAAINEITGYPEKYPLENDATLSMQWIYDRDASQFTNKRQEWLSGGATFSTVDPDTVDGIWLHHGAGVPHFADRFFLPLQPLMIEHLGEVLCQVQAGGDDAKHTFFAALVSAAAGTDLFDTFAGLYHYPIMPDLYESARTAFSGIIAQRECPGDFNKDGSSNAADLAVFAVDFGKTGCSVSSCNGDFNTDGDVDGSELAAFISKFGRADCL